MKANASKKGQNAGGEWNARTVSHARMECLHGITCQNGILTRYHMPEWNAHTVSHARKTPLSCLAL